MVSGNFICIIYKANQADVFVLDFDQHIPGAPSFYLLPDFLQNEKHGTWELQHQLLHYTDDTPGLQEDDNQNSLWWISKDTVKNNFNQCEFCH